MSLLEVNDLRVCFAAEEPPVYAVNGVSFSMQAGEAVAIVGESASGKTVTALSLLGLHAGSHTTVEGSISFNGQALHELSDAGWRAVRGNDISMVFQDPGTALNPAMTVGRQISETLQRHRALSRPEAIAKAVQGLEAVGLEADDARKYPHQMSGGQKQRVMIAIAVACEPKLLIADEPTTALDVTTQAQIVELVKSIRSDMAVLWITHDLALAATLVDRVIVMYGGRIAEEAPVAQLFARPAHPYTKALLAAVPNLNSVRGQPLVPIEGTPPRIHAPLQGCAFYDRCTYRIDACRTTLPTLEATGGQHHVACIRHAAVEEATST